MAQPQTPYIGSKISLISMLDIRYEGILYFVNSQESTIALSKVRSFGTEDRSSLHPVPARDQVYEFIIFKANDIKDLVVCGPSKPSSGPAYDPAIISVSAGESQDSEKDLPAGSSPLEEKPQPTQWLSQQQQQGSNAQSRGGFGRSRRDTNDGDRPSDGIALKSQSNQHQDNSGSNVINRQRQQYHNYNVRNNDNSNNDYRQQNNFRSHNRNYNNHQGGAGQNNHQRDRFKYDSDFDFEKANEKFKEQLGAVTADLSNVNIEGDENVETLIRSGSSSPAAEIIKETFYNKSTSFFDNISCEALEKTEGKNNRLDWKKERMTNQETFGHSAVRSLAYRRGQRGFGPSNGGGGNLQNRLPYQQQQQSYNNFNNNNNYPKRNFNHNQQQRQNYGNQGGGFRQNNYQGHNHHNNNQQQQQGQRYGHQNYQGGGRRQQNYQQQNRAGAEL